MLAEFAIVLAFYVVSLSACIGLMYALMFAWALLKALVGAWKEWAQADEGQGRP